MQASSQTPIEVFCSYAHEDEALLDQLHTHLATLKRQNLITVWHDRQILPGSDWFQAIDAHLEQSALILLLISPDFLASDYCYKIEMKRALERHEANEARVIPSLFALASGMMLPLPACCACPRMAKPVTQLTDRDQVWESLDPEIKGALQVRFQPSDDVVQTLSSPHMHTGIL